MRVPLSWLRDLTPVDLPLTELVSVLDELGLPVESVERVGEGLDGVVVAEVLSTGPIEGADRIQVVQVDPGTGESLQIVCGAWNFGPGDLVPLAPVGTVLPGGLEIGRRKMRGVESNGMLCAPDELGLPGGHEGILVLPPGSTPGTSLPEAVGVGPDVVLELEVNANRPDASSVAGVARDLAAKLGLPFTLPEPLLSEGPTPAEQLASVEVAAPDLCGRFVARVLTGVRVGPSPPWLARRVTLAGMRSINNVVDASNYVMLELGQPNHAYDLALLPGRGLRVRRAMDGETLVTLDDLERRLTTEDLLICDAEDNPVGIAGVMGGASSEVSDTTTEVLLEAAWFSPFAVARTSKRLKLRTEASARFERGCDPQGIDRAADRFSELLAAGGATPAAGGIDVRGELPDPPVVRLRTARVNAVLGTALADEEVWGHLERIGFATARAGEGLADVTVPSWRPDSATEIDLIEEVARLHGYSKVEKTVPCSPQTGALTPYQKDRRLVRSILAGTGASEAWTPTFLAPADLERVGLDPSAAVGVTNPLVAEEHLLRPSLLPGMLGALAYNAGHRTTEVELFEVGHVFALPREGSLPDERESLAVALSGEDARDAVATWWALVEGLGIDPGQISLEAASPVGLHPTRSAEVVAAGSSLGVVGEVDPTAVADAGLAGRVGWLEVDLAGLLALPHGEAVYRPVSRYPSSDVDLAFEVDDATPAVAVERSLRDAAGDLVEVRLFDVYRGEPVPEGRRSLAFRVRFQAPDHTLTDEEVAAARTRLIEAVESAHPATLRG